MANSAHASVDMNDDGLLRGTPVTPSRAAPQEDFFWATALHEGSTRRGHGGRGGREGAEALADTNGDGLLDEAEFVRLAREMEAGQEEAWRRWLRETFQMYEIYGRGWITPLSLKLMLGKRQDIAECEAMIRRFDLDRDGVLTFVEFKTMMEPWWDPVRFIVCSVCTQAAFRLGSEMFSALCSWH
jgi:hypothetical protein